MIVVEIDVPIWSREYVSEDDNNLILLDNLQLLEEVRDAARWDLVWERRVVSHHRKIFFDH